MANMMTSPFLKSAAVVLAKRAIIGVMNSASLVEFSSGDKWTVFIKIRVKSRYVLYQLLIQEQLMLAMVEKEISNFSRWRRGWGSFGRCGALFYHGSSRRGKEGIKKKKKKKYKPKAGRYQMEAGIKRFGERGGI
jgi:hypothetical protein